MKEKDIAIMEGEESHFEDEYFAARPKIDNKENRRIFQAGFYRAWEKRNYYEKSNTVVVVSDHKDIKEIVD